MKKIMYVRTNGYDMLVTYEPDEKIVRYTENMDVEQYLHNLNAIEDDSSWQMEENITDIEEWLKIDHNDPEAPKILEEIVTEI